MDLFHACPGGGRDKAWLDGHEGQDPGGQLMGPVAVRFEPSCLSFLTPLSLEAEGFACFPPARAAAGLAGDDAGLGRLKCLGGLVGIGRGHVA